MRTLIHWCTHPLNKVALLGLVGCSLYLCPQRSFFYSLVEQLALLLLLLLPLLLMAQGQFRRGGYYFRLPIFSSLSLFHFTGTAVT